MAARSGLAAGMVIAVICIGGAACNALMGLDDLDMTYDPGAGGQGGAGGAGGAGGVEPECKPEECMPENECQLPVCVDSKCGFYTLREASSPMQVPGDCKETWCDAEGQPMPQPDIVDLPDDDGTECTDDLCDSGTPVHPPRPNGTPCRGSGTGERCVNGACIPTCDYSGNCGDSTSGCLGCALLGDCADELAICQGSQECIDYGTCLDPCVDQACVDQCAAAYPTGATLYHALFVCSVCERCPVDCDAVGSGCP